MENNKKPKCLLVDDLEENLIALKGLLQEENVECLTARTGEEALGLLLDNDFAFALLDVQMPGMNGFELAEIMRSTEKTRTIPIIFVTAAGNDVQRVFQGYQAGAVDFLHKPLHSEILLGKVNVFLMLHAQKVQLEERLREIQKKEASLQQALKSRDEFLAICSHELKTPLTSLRLQIQMNNRLKQKSGEEVVFSSLNMQKFIDNTELSVERLIQLVNDMLDLSFISSGKLTLQPEKLNLSVLVQDVLKNMKSFIEDAQCTLKVNSTHDVIGLWDERRISQVITNLINNACKYAPKSMLEITITTDDLHAILIIRDSGAGIPEEDQERIFEKFERATPYTSISGLGLGLYLAREIVKLHKGTIEVQSQLGVGTVFTVQLPLR